MDSKDRKEYLKKLETEIQKLEDNLDDFWIFGKCCLVTLLIILLMCIGVFHLSEERSHEYMITTGMITKVNVSIPTSCSLLSNGYYDTHIYYTFSYENTTFSGEKLVKCQFISSADYPKRFLDNNISVNILFQKSEPTINKLLYGGHSIYWNIDWMSTGFWVNLYFWIGTILLTLTICIGIGIGGMCCDYDREHHRLAKKRMEVYPVMKEVVVFPSKMS